MIIAKQVAPELQEDNLFYQHDRNLYFEDDYFTNHVIIHGNKEFLGIDTKEFSVIKKFSNDLWYDWEYLQYTHTEFIEYYFKRTDGKRYSKRDLSMWIKLLNNWTESTEDIITALNLMTRRNWRSVTIRGCMQREWQCMYVDDMITNGDVDYIEMCYFNTGMEFNIFDNDEYIDTRYVRDVDELCENYEFEIERNEFKVFEFDGYVNTPKYKEVMLS